MISKKFRLECTIIFLFFLGVLLIASVPALAKNISADFIIVENSQALTIYNRYEQALPRSRPRFFLPNTPFRILETKAFLSDGLTSVFRVELLGRSFFILTDEQGKIVGQGNAGYIKRFKNCTLIEDTVRVTPSGSVLFARSRKALKNNGRRLQSGEELVRIFKYKNTYYIQILSNRRFGWCKSSPKGLCQKIRASTKPAALGLRADLIDKIQNKLQQANRRYQKFFNWFNRRQDKQIQAPQWQVKQRNGTVRFVLSGSAAVSYLKMSTGILIEEINRLLSGRPYSARYRPKEHTIYLVADKKK